MKNNAENFVAILLSGDHKKWFPTEVLAWDYVHDQSCDDCKANPKYDMCSAEWDVWSKEEYDKYSK